MKLWMMWLKDYTEFPKKGGADRQRGKAPSDQPFRKPSGGRPYRFIFS